MNTLDKIAQLRAALMRDTTPEQTEGWWRLYESIRSDLDYDRNLSKYERTKLREVKDGLSVAAGMIRQGLPSPNTISADVALSALKHSIERRTIGPDGWPLRG